MMLDEIQYRNLAMNATRIAGCVNQLVALRNKPLSVESMRNLTNKIYDRTDEFILLMEQYLKQIKKRGN